MKEVTCPFCDRSFLPEIKPRSTTGRCSQCGHELPEIWRWKRCAGCNEHERVRIAKYRSNKKLKPTKQTIEAKQAPLVVADAISTKIWDSNEFGTVLDNDED